MNNKPKMVLFIILLSAILEKAVWRVAGMRLSLYFIIGLIVVCYVFIHQKGIIQFQPQTQILFKNRLWLLMFSAFQLMIINHGDDFLSQYVKGFIELFLFIIVFHIYSSQASNRRFFFILSYSTVYCKDW